MNGLTGAVNAPLVPSVPSDLPITEQSHRADAAVSFLAGDYFPYTVVFQGEHIGGSTVDAVELWMCLTSVLAQSGAPVDRPDSGTTVGDYAREVDNWRRWNNYALATAYDRALHAERRAAS
jgi:hypothetical protein